MPRVAQSLLYSVQVGCSFILMLLIMTFNVWIFLFAVTGMAIGHFLFSPMASTMDTSDCCN